MKRIYVALVLFLLSWLCVDAQNIAVQSFYLAETDLTANTPGTMVQDQNDDVCALIKVETTQKGFTFDVGVLGVTSTQEKSGEIWVYVPFGVRKISVHHPQLGVLRDYQFPVAIEKGRTYIMKLTSGSVRTIVENTVTKQYLCLEVDPADAFLELNGKIQYMEKGVYQQPLPFGRYEYKVTAENYHDLVGVVQLDDPENAHVLQLKLKPAFGHVSVLSGSQYDIQGAFVYIDNKLVGRIPVRDIELPSGTHRIRIMAEMYNVYDDTFVVSDEEKKVLNPVLVPDFADITLNTIEGAEIYVNGEKKGTTRWSGRLASGSYIVETRKDGHVPYKTNYDITPADQSKSIQIAGPTPIYGVLDISSTPIGATITINGKPSGQTPKYISRQLIGDYSVTVEKEGYIKQTKSVSVKEGQESSLSFSLELYRKPAETKPASSSTYTPKSRTVYSREFTMNVGDEVTARLSEGKVTKWTIGASHVAYVSSYNDVLKAIAPGVIKIFGEINGSPKLFEITILGDATSSYASNSASGAVSNNSSSARIVYSQTERIKVGERVGARLSEGLVDRWEIDSKNSKFVDVLSGGVLRAKAVGKIIIWGYIGNTPKLFEFNVVDSNTTASTSTASSNARRIKVGTDITVLMPNVYGWELNSSNSSYLSILPGGVIKAVKPGVVEIWASQNGVRKQFKFIIE